MIQRGRIDGVIRKHQATAKSISLIKKSLTARKPNAREPADLALLATCLIHQLEEENRMHVLKPEFLVSQTAEIISYLKKCPSADRAKPMLKLIGLYRQMKKKMSAEMQEPCSDLVNHLAALGEKSSERLVEMVTMERMDESIMFMFRNFKEKQEEFIDKFHKIAIGLSAHFSKIQRVLSSAEYAEFTGNIKILNLSRKINSSKDRSNHTKDMSFKLSAKSKISYESISSENSEAYNERLRKFDETSEKNDFVKQFLMLQTDKKKRRSCLRVSSKLAQTPKRISTTWGKGLLSSTFSKEQEIRRNSAYMTSQHKIKPAPSERENSVVIDSVSSSARKAMYSELHIPKEKEDCSEFMPFYVFVCVNDNLRCVTVRSMTSEEAGNFIKFSVKFEGVFTQLLILKRSCYSITLKMTTEEIAQFIANSIQIKSKKIWRALYPKLQKNLDFASTHATNILFEEPISMIKTYYGFIAVANVRFFGKYMWESEQNVGQFHLYDSHCDDKVEIVKLSPKEAKNKFKIYEVYWRNEERGESFHDVNSVSVTPKPMNEEPAVSLPGINALGLSKTPSPKRQQIYEVVRINGCFRILTQKYDATHQSVLIHNTGPNVHNLAARNQLLYQSSIRCPSECAGTLASLKHKITLGMMKKPCRMRSVLGRRSFQSQLAFTEFQFNFIYRVKSMPGFFYCKFTVFERTHSHLVLLDIYQNQLQKYFQLQLDFNVLQAMFRSQFQRIPHKQLRKYFQRIRPQIHITEISHQREANKRELEFSFGNHRIAFRELITRSIETDSQKNPTKIHCIFKTGEEITPVPELKYTFTEQSIIVQKRLVNNKQRHFQLIKPNLLLQSKHLYHHLIQDAKHMMAQELSKTSRKDQLTYYYFCQQSVAKVLQKGKQWSLWQDGNVAGMNMERLYGGVWEKLRGKAQKGVLRRTLRDGISRRIVLV